MRLLEDYQPPALSRLERLKLAGRLAFGRLKQTDTAPENGMLASLIGGVKGGYVRRNTGELIRTFNTSPWIRACSSTVSDAFASIHWRLVTVRSRTSKRIWPGKELATLKTASMEAKNRLFKQLGPDDQVQEIRNHLLLDLLNQANPLMTGYDLRWLMQSWLDLAGYAFFLKSRNSMKAPDALWPVPPHWVLETPNNRTPGYRIDFFGRQQIWPVEDVLALHYSDPINPYGRGSGIVGALSDEVAIDEYAAKHGIAFFRNNARPDILVMPAKGESMGEKERDRLDAWWNEQLQGFWRRFKPLFMRQAMEVKVIEQNLQDMQFTQVRTSEADIIHQTWRIPPEIFGRLANSNRATAVVARDHLARFCLVPRAERVREALQTFLLPEYDERLVLLYDSPIPEDEDYTLSVMKSEPSAFELNEFRSRAGFAPKDELDGQFGTGKAGGTFSLQNASSEDLAQLREIMERIEDRR